MIRRLQLKGKKFGRLRVIAFARSDANGQTLWKCRCVCGMVLTLRGNALKTGNTKSCGCLKDEQTRDRARSKTINLIRRKFGRLTVVKFSGYKKSKAVWVCRCDCGVTKNIHATELLGGKVRSCNCFRIEQFKKSQFRNLNGQRFGHLQVVNFYGYVKHGARWTCRCDCGNTSIVFPGNLLSGASTTCGKCKFKNYRLVSGLWTSNRAKVTRGAYLFCKSNGYPFTEEAIKLWLERQVLLGQYRALQSQSSQLTQSRH
jgi:hypothetical protein